MYQTITTSKGRFGALRREINATLAAVRTTEGERGVATRWAVVFRYLAYLGGIVAIAAVVGAMPALGTLASQLIIVSSVMIIVTAAVGTIAFPTERRALVDQMRFFVFGIVCFPSVVLGALLSVVNNANVASAGISAAGSSDALIVGIGQSAIPYLFWATVVVPPFLFVKTVVGMRKLHRQRMDDEEAVRLWTRQDGLYK